MSRALLCLANAEVRKRAVAWIQKAPEGTRVEFKAPQRTLDQNSLMWAMLTDISVQKEHCGRKYTPDHWKALFLSALGQEIQFIPSLDGKTFIPLGMSSSDLSKQEMSDMIDFMGSWGAENSVVFHQSPM